MNNTKFIFVTGGVISGLGKGIVSASIAKILQTETNKVIILKADPYLNYWGASNQAPKSHGETFVLCDSTECDLDLGHYERFLNKPCFSDFSSTSGKILSKILEKEKRGDYLGDTIQIIPHVTQEIRSNWKEVVKKHKADIAVIEIGGNISDIEASWYIEAIREMIQKEKSHNTLVVHLGYIPEIGENKQQKTKPIQQSLSLLKGRGISPDIVIGRASKPLEEKTKDKLFWLSNISKDCIFSDPDLATVYEYPSILLKEGIEKILKNKLKIKSINDLRNWNKRVKRILRNKKSKDSIKIGICGKYADDTDAYLSVVESLIHSTSEVNKRIDIVIINSEKLPINLEDFDGFIVPGGFGPRGTDGKIKVIRCCRENNIPFLGLCYGLQLAIVEFARNICKLKNANSTEIDKKTQYNVIDLMDSQKNIKDMSGTMRLGSQKAFLKKGSQISKIYKSETCEERHRHRYEVNPEYHNILEKNGLVLSGKDESGKLVEFIEYPKCNFFIATQAHPELQSTLEAPSPIFVAFLKSVCLLKEEKKNGMLE